MKTCLIASLAAAGVLLLVNLFVFPLVFGAGVPVPYAGLRAEPQYAWGLVALLVTATLLAVICGRGERTIAAASLTSALAGLLASLPSALHLLSLVEVTPGSQIAPVLWTAVTWGFAGSTIGAVYGRAAR